MEKILNESIDNLSGWHLQIMQAIEYSLRILENAKKKLDKLFFLCI